MHIAFRTDASLQIGTGHVMRCLTLADAMRERGAHCTFIGRVHDGHLMDLVEHRRHKALRLPLRSDGYAAAATPAHAVWLGTDWATDAQQSQQLLVNEAVDWLVVDHYALDDRWEQAMRTNSKRLMVIDDLADRSHDCDLLLDQNLGRDCADYSDLLKPNTATLIGPTYALLRPAFAQLRPYSLARRIHPQFKRLLITMGGVDKDNVTGQVLNVLQKCQLPIDMQITVVMGPHAPWLREVKEQATQTQVPTQVLVGVDQMAQLMADSDLAIGAAGGTSWERCCLGLPTVLLVLAPNQHAGAQALFKSGAAITLENAQQLQDLFRSMDYEAPLRNTLQQMSVACAALTAGNGAMHVAQMLEQCHV